MQRDLFSGAARSSAPAAKPAVKSRARFSPRDYQQAAIDNTYRLFEQGSPGVLVVQPTGSGKTVTGTLVAERWIDQGPDYHVMICAHERQLVSQFAEEVQSILGIRPAVEMADNRVAWGWKPKIIVSSRQTLMENKRGQSRLHRFDQSKNWLLLIDEAHRWKRGLKSCRHILEWFEGNPLSRRLGLTATPERGDSVSLAGILPDIGLDYRLYDVFGGPSAVNDGWAVPYRQAFVTVEGVEWKDVRDVAGDFNDEDLERLLSERETILSMVKPTIDLVGDRRTIVFSPTAAMARRVSEAFNEHREGSALSLDGTCPDDQRQRVYRDHQSGRFQFLSVCGLCREGYNDPGIAAVAVYRPTKSRSLAEQMKGRGCRPLRGLVDGLPDAEARRAAIAASAKPDCLIVDLVGITGMPPVSSTADILAAGLPDEVIERAKKAIEEKGEDADMQEEIRNAKAAVDSEKAEADRKELERREREEAKKRARLQGRVKYQATEVGQGQGGAHTSRAGGDEPVWPYGKNKGRKFGELHEKFLQWASRELTGKLRTRALAELERRENSRSSGAPVAPRAAPTAVTPGQQRLLQRHGLTATTFAEAAALIAQATSARRELQAN
jgi:hypothetical protein